MIGLHGWSQKIRGYEYWFDDQVEAKVSVDITPVRYFHLQESMALDTLPNGFHTLSLRFADTANHWSSVLTQYFIKYPPATAANKQIVACEYWLDDDYAGKTTRTVSPTATYHLTDSLDLGAIPNGFHLLHLRFRDNSGAWSSVLTQYFMKYPQQPAIDNKIVALRYWFDDDDENMTTIGLDSPAKYFHWADSLETPWFTQGNHMINYQFMDSRHAYSIVQTDTFLVPQCYPRTVSVNAECSQNPFTPGDTVTFSETVENPGIGYYINWFVNDSLMGSTGSANNGLVAYYPFNGNTQDESGNNRHGTPYGNPALTTDRFGVPNAAYLFDGADDWIDCGSWFNYNKFSISFWVKETGYTGNYTDIIDNNHTGGQNWVIQSTPNSSEYGFGIAGCGGGNFTLPINEWHHVVCVKDSVNMMVYLDGIEQFNIPSGYAPNYTGHHLFISRWGGGGRHFKGVLDEIKFFNRPLSTSDISALFNASLNGVFAYAPGNCDSVYCVVTSMMPCALNSPDTSNILVMRSVLVPDPTITGPDSVCVSGTGNSFSTESGMANYQWSISPGGTISYLDTLDQHMIEASWSTTGSHWLKVNYENEERCAGLPPVQFDVVVQPLPTPTISGMNEACQGSSGITYSTEAGMTNYDWTIAPGGFILGGLSENSVSVYWQEPGAKWIRVNYSDSTGCAALTPTQFDVLVHPFPQPALTGEDTVCSGYEGMLYTTDGGNSNYTWSVSPDNFITGGGGVNDSTATVTWSVPGNQWIRVNYTDINGCRDTVDTQFDVFVKPTAIPSLDGPNQVCIGTTSVVYSTESGMAGYSWGISTGGIIIAGGAPQSNTLTVTWNSTGAQWVEVVYSSGNGCQSLQPTRLNVQVNPLPVPQVFGNTNQTACLNSTRSYSTSPGMSNYLWNISSGGTIVSGGLPSNSNINISWNTLGPQWISVNYTDVSGCAATQATVSSLTVVPRPQPTISGASLVCQLTTPTQYSTEAGMSNYSWTVSPGGVIAGGTTSNVLTVIWNTVGSHFVKVNYYNTNFCPAVLPANFPVSVGVLGGVVSGSGTLLFGQSTGALNLTGHYGTVSKWQKKYNSTFYEDIPSTSGLTGYTETPVYTGIWDYRAVIANGSCPQVYSDPATIYVTLPVGSRKIWEGSQSEDWHNPLNWKPFGVPVATDNVDIPLPITYPPKVKNDTARVNELTIYTNGSLDVDTGQVLTANGHFVIDQPCPPLASPVEGIHIAARNAITWHWDTISGANGYKWNSVNDYQNALDLGSLNFKPESGLVCDSTYARYVWAYDHCTHSNPVMLVFSTLSCAPSCGEPFIDSRNGKSYNTVTIGNQCWMKENLDIGLQIDNHIGMTNDGGIEKYCYDDSPANCNIYGGMYQWGEAVNYLNGASNTSSWNPEPVTSVRGICPLGWHLPSKQEFDSLAAFLGGQDVAGGAMKEAGTAHWASPNTGATNSSEFTALPGGYKPNLYYYNRTEYGYFWTSTNTAATTVNIATLVYNTATLWLPLGTKSHAFSVRCLKDTCSSVPNAPSPGANLPNPDQIIWYWSTVPGALGYKWNAVNDYGTAIDLGSGTTYIENGLTCNTLYTRYVWAYNACGHSAPLLLNQTTNSCSGPCGQPYTDTRNGKTYSTVQIGNQCWMRENMNIGGRLNTQVAQTNNATLEKYCLNDSETGCNLYGALYQWGEAVQYLNGASNTSSWNPVPTGNVVGICPNGWHIPSPAEVDTLATYLGGYAIAGGKMKEFGISHWSTPNTGATNSSLFTALPGGYKPNDYYYSWMDLGYFWLSGENDPTHADYMLLTFQSASLGKNAAPKPYGYSVRCLQD